MEQLAKIKEMLKELSQEEKEELKGILNTTDDTSEEAEVKEDSAVEQATDETSEDKEIAQENSDEKAEDISEEKPEVVEPTEAEENSEEAAEQTETSEETAGAEEDANNEMETPTEEPVSEQEDDIPLMQKGVSASEDETVDDGSITAETGEKIPVDYEQIIEGQNAKIAALEAENASLRNKVEGAFGYSAKPSSPAKVNRLYDECEDIHFHK